MTHGMIAVAVVIAAFAIGFMAGRDSKMFE
jgi:Flp pilus assembly protein protease CpaA